MENQVYPLLKNYDLSIHKLDCGGLDLLIPREDFYYPTELGFGTLELMSYLQEEFNNGNNEIRGKDLIKKFEQDKKITLIPGAVDTKGKLPFLYGVLEELQNLKIISFDQEKITKGENYDNVRVSGIETFKASNPYF